jgi:hypothetical protein
MTSERRFPPPWTIEDKNDACFIVRDHDGQALAYVYYENEPGRRAVKHPHPDAALAEDCVTVPIDWFDFIRSAGEYQCRTRSKLRRSESGASMHYRC